jgi:hypothetical protein
MIMVNLAGDGERFRYAAANHRYNEEIQGERALGCAELQE